MLIVLFKIAGEQYGLDARTLTEILPAIPLRPFPGAPAGVAGLLTHRGEAVPVIDLALLTGGEPCPSRLSTRIVIADYSPGPPGARIGLRVEYADDAIQVKTEDFRDAGVTAPDARYLGKIIQHPLGLIQLIDVERLIPEPLQQCLYQESGVS
jgi:chemotaxis-related protein WspB